jgi:hypothetical protein
LVGAESPHKQGGAKIPHPAEQVMDEEARFEHRPLKAAVSMRAGKLMPRGNERSRCAADGRHHRCIMINNVLVAVWLSTMSVWRGMGRDEPLWAQVVRVAYGSIRSKYEQEHIALNLPVQLLR